MQFVSSLPGCFPAGDLQFLKAAKREHLNSKGLMHRVYPQPVNLSVREDGDVFVTREDQILHDWFRAMCQKDSLWCE